MSGSLSWTGPSSWEVKPCVDRPEFAWALKFWRAFQPPEFVGQGDDGLATQPNGVFKLMTKCGSGGSGVAHDRGPAAPNTSKLSNTLRNFIEHSLSGFKRLSFGLRGKSIHHVFWLSGLIPGRADTQ